MVVILEELLGLSKGNAYKRIRGEPPLTLAEVFLLAETHQISLDQWIFRDTGQVAVHSCRCCARCKAPQRFYDAFIPGAGQPVPDMVVHYATTEMAGFQYLIFPELTAFKFHMWNAPTWELAAYDQPKFSPKLYTEDAELETARLAFWRLWNQTPTSEYWRAAHARKYLSQVRFMAYEGSFEQPETASLIGEQIMELIGIWEKMANTGLKPTVTGDDGLPLPPVAFTSIITRYFILTTSFCSIRPPKAGWS